MRHLSDLYGGKLADKAVSLAELTAPEQEVEDMMADYANEYRYLLVSAAKSWTAAARNR